MSESHPEYVRVRRPEDGTEFSIVKSALDSWPELEVLDKDASRGDGTPIPPKPRVPLGGAAERAPKYGDMSLTELRREIDARNASRDDENKLPKAEKKAALAASLEADDKTTTHEVATENNVPDDEGATADANGRQATHPDGQQAETSKEQ